MLMVSVCERLFDLVLLSSLILVYLVMFIPFDIVSSCGCYFFCSLYFFCSWFFFVCCYSVLWCFPLFLVLFFFVLLLFCCLSSIVIACLLSSSCVLFPCVVYERLCCVSLWLMF